MNKYRDIGEEYEELLKDICEDEEKIRALAMQVLPEKDCMGDTYYVPGPVDIVEMLVEEIQRLRKAQEEPGRCDAYRMQ